jgi:glycerate kinase
MKILIAPDSFKSSATSLEIATWLEIGIKSVIPRCETILTPIGDGGEGSLDAALHAGFTATEFVVTGPTSKPVRARLGMKGDVALVELAQASGLSQLPNKVLAPMQATSYGTGELILHALDQGARTVILAIGGSACTDAGAGALQALGAHIRDSAGHELPAGGAALAHAAALDLSTLDSRIVSTHFILASDVTNPLIGQAGAAEIYSPQKGADADQVKELEAAITHFASLAGSEHINSPGAGAAGGFGYMALTFLSAVHQSGIDTFLSIIDFESKLAGVDYVITGEGKFDSQSMRGKTPFGIYCVATASQIPVILVCGQAELNMSDELRPGFKKIYTLNSFQPDISQCIADPRPIVEKIGQYIALSLHG